MGDAGEGLVDAEARLQEHLEQRAEERLRGQRVPVRNPDQVRRIESLRLARVELARQVSATDHPVRRKQIEQALADLDRRIADAARAE